MYIYGYFHAYTVKIWWIYFPYIWYRKDRFLICGNMHGGNMLNFSYIDMAEIWLISPIDMAEIGLISAIDIAKKYCFNFMRYADIISTDKKSN